MNAVVNTDTPAFAFVKRLAAELSAGEIDLPSFPEVAVQVRRALESFAIEQLQREPALKPVEKPLRALWGESTHVAALCYALAKRTRIRPDEAFLAGLLHTMGRLYVLVRSVEYSGLAADTAALADIVASWHTAIAKAILENWNLPPRVCRALPARAAASGGAAGRSRCLKARSAVRGAT